MEKKKQGFLRELAGIVIPAVLIVAVVQSFIFKPFRIPSESMQSTLLVGDYVYVSKYSYGYSKYSFPFSLPLFSGRILASEPKRGDVIVFRLPTNPSIDYIKRLVGLPGDTIQVIGGVLHINGQPVQLERIADFREVEDGVEFRAPRYRETLPGGVVHEILDLQPAGPLDNTEVYRVPPGHYFMMGDNRDDSIDSRVLREVGYVPFENLVGRADLVFFSVADRAPAWAFWRWPWTLRWGRLLSRVH